MCQGLIWVASALPGGTCDTQHATWEINPNTQLTSTASSFDVWASLLLLLDREPVSEGSCTLDSKFLSRL